MILRPYEVDDFRRQVCSGADLTPFKTAPIRAATLGGVVELVCSWAYWSHQNTPAARIVERWAQDIEALGTGIERLRLRRNQKVADFWVKPQWELYVISGADGWLGAEGTDFQQRFSRSLSGNNFEQKLARGISKAFAEMASNVLEHSVGEGVEPALALVGYHVEPGWMSFSIGDLGRGVLSSLRTNPRWAHLETEEQALFAAVRDRATRRMYETHGNGFQEVHRALMNRNGRLRFRSGDASLTVDGASALPLYIPKSSPPLPGFQLTITCALTGKPEPRAL